MWEGLSSSHGDVFKECRKQQTGSGRRVEKLLDHLLHILHTIFVVFFGVFGEGDVGTPGRTSKGQSTELSDWLTATSAYLTV